MIRCQVGNMHISMVVSRLFGADESRAAENLPLWGGGRWSMGFAVLAHFERATDRLLPTSQTTVGG